MSAGGDSAGVDIRSIIQLLLRDSGSEIVVTNSHIFVENYLRCSVFLLSPPQPLPCKCVQQNTPPWPSMRVCQVCRGIRGRSSSVKLCRRMLLSAMLGISSRRTEGRCRTVRKLIRCEVLPTLAIVRPELVRTVRTSAQHTMGPKRKQLYGNQLCPSCSSGCSNQANNQVWMRAV